MSDPTTAIAGTSGAPSAAPSPDTIARVASFMANPVGYVLTDPGTASQAARETGQVVKDVSCKDDPSSAACRGMTDSWCQLAGFPAAICDKDGLRSWFLWTLGLTGVAALGGLGYVAYRAAKVAAPIALGVYAPQALPAYQALQKGDKGAAQEHVIKAVQEHMAAKRAVGTEMPLPGAA